MSIQKGVVIVIKASDAFRWWKFDAVNLDKFKRNQQAHIVVSHIQ